MPLPNTARGLLHLTRPLEWSKTFGNMVIGAILAFYYLPITDFNLLLFDLPLFLLAFFAAGPLLWGGLYALNDFTDWAKDKLHPVKKNRPIPSGDVSPSLAKAYAALLIVSAFLIGFLLNNGLFLICLAGMLLNQLLYTLPPFHLKKRAVLDLISGSLINPFFRFYAGWVLFIPAFNAPWLMLVFILGFQFGGYLLYRMSGKRHEQSLNYKSSIVVFGEDNLKKMAYLALIIGTAAYLISTLTNVLPFHFIWLAVLSAFLLPVYTHALKDPKNIDIARMYRIIYLHLIGFILGFIFLFML